MHDYRKTTLKLLIAAIGLSCGLLALPADACVTPTPSEARFSGPDALPLKVPLREGGRLVFSAMPHSSNVVVYVSGDLEVISKVGDPMLAVGVRADAPQQVSTLLIGVGDRSWMTDIAVGGQSLKPVVDFSEGARRPEFILYRRTGEFELRLPSDSANVRVRHRDRGLDLVPRRQDFDRSRKLVRLLFSFDDINLDDAPKVDDYPEATIFVIQNFRGLTQWHTLRVRNEPIPRC